jgi:hypothetical protein
MFTDDTRNKIKNIISGISIEGANDTGTTIRNLLCAGFATSTTVKKEFESKAILKEEQANLLEKYCKEQHLWLTDLPDNTRYLIRGGEARVYLDADKQSVIKVNDGVYYATWLEFFNNILLHNLIFENTALSSCRSMVS